MTRQQPMGRGIARANAGVAIAFAVFTLQIESAHADQCSVLTKAQAERAKKLIEESKEIWLFCAPCDDRTPERKRVESASISGKFELTTKGPDGEVPSLDLAYVFIATADKKGEYTNLAALADCPVLDTPYTIDANGPKVKELPVSAQRVDLDGVYSVIARKPEKGLPEISAIALSGESRSAKGRALVNGKPVTLKQPKIADKAFTCSFTTAKATYTFAGNFKQWGDFATMSLPENSAVLSGRLTKTVPGNTAKPEVVELDFSFRPPE